MRRTRVTVPLAVAALILAPGVANAQLRATGAASSFEGAPTLNNPIFEQLADCTGIGAASQEFPDIGGRLQSADDFNVSGQQTLDQVIALGVFSQPAGAAYNSITIEVYDNDGPGGLPGTLRCSETGLVNAGGASNSVIDVALDGSCTLGSGSYWMSVVPVMPFGEEGEVGQWFWSSTGIGFGSEFAFIDPDELLPPGPCNDWGLGQSTCGVTTTFPDLCFGVGAQSGTGDGGTGTPAVGTTGAIVMLLVVMAISFFYLRRRQTA